MGSAAAAGPGEPAEPTLRPSSASGTEQTLHGAAVGTIGYMSPEQAAGRLDQLGPASDVYSLGATLYYLLTGKVPFAGDSAEVLKKVQAGDFAPPREAHSAVPAADGSVWLCEALVKSSPPQCGEPRILVLNIGPDAFFGDPGVHVADGVRWVDQVQLFGFVRPS